MKRKYIYKKTFAAILSAALIFGVSGRGVFAESGQDDVEYASRFIELIFGKRKEEEEEASEEEESSDEEESSGDEEEESSEEEEEASDEEEE